MGESKGVEPGVELEVNCHNRVNLVISSGIDSGFFTTIPTATGSVGGETQKIFRSQLFLRNIEIKQNVTVIILTFFSGWSYLS